MAIFEEMRDGINTLVDLSSKTFKLQVAGEKIKIQPHYKVTTQKYLI